jgi:dipeptidyl aminopeptidase/acylaminoacyl peptidase
MVIMTESGDRRKGVSRRRHGGPLTIVVVSRSVEISPELCVAGRDLTEPRPSPTGATVAFVLRWGAESAIVVVPVSGGPERQLTVAPRPAGGRGFGGGCFDWVPDGSAVVYAASDGDLWLQRTDGAPAVRLTDHGRDRSVQAPSVSPDGRWVAYAVDQAEIWRVSLDQAPAHAERIDDGSADFCADPFATADAVRWQAWNVPDMPWDGARTEIAHLHASRLDRRETRVGTGAIQQPRTLVDGTPVEVRDDTGWLNVWIGERPLIDEAFEHAGPSWGMGQRSYAESPDGALMAFTRNESGFGRLCVLDRATGSVHDIGRGVHGQLGWSGDVLVALRSGARTPIQLVTYRPSNGSGAGTTWERKVLVVGAPVGWDHLDLPEPEPFVVDHDGTPIHARRYACGNGRTICWVHGGPTDQWDVTFMPRISYWWSRGWDVVVPDPRGTTGHGRAYQQALHGQWGRLDVDDTAAVIRHAHASGWSEPAGTVVMGGSSGGLTALGVLGLHPGLAAGGAVSYPVCDLADLSEHSHRFEAHYTLSLVGPLDDVDLYQERSPLSYAHRIDVPLLVMHGDADPVVPVEQSIMLADRIRSAGGDVELHILEGEGHGFRDPQNRLDEFEIVGRFLDRVLDRP